MKSLTSKIARSDYFQALKDGNREIVEAYNAQMKVRLAKNSRKSRVGSPSGDFIKAAKVR